MARVYYGDIVTNMVGSVGNATYAKNRYGAYKKNKPIPTNRNSAAQAVVRAAMQQAVSNWQTSLTAANIAAWNHAAELHRRQKLGQEYALSGLNLYSAYYVQMIKIGETPLDEPTVFSGAPNFILPDITEVVVDGHLEISAWSETDTDLWLLVQATDAVGQHISYRNTPFKESTFLQAGGSVPVAIPVTYPAGSGDLYRVFFQVSVLDDRGAVSSKLSYQVDGEIV